MSFVYLKRTSCALSLSYVNLSTVVLPAMIYRAIYPRCLYKYSILSGLPECIESRLEKSSRIVVEKEAIRTCTYLVQLRVGSSRTAIAFTPIQTSFGYSIVNAIS